MKTHIDKARAIARIAHANQVDKVGAPYFEHCMRVANSERIMYVFEVSAAYLHDVLEDTAVTVEDLVDLLFDSVIIETVERLTRKPGEPYFDYITRVSEDASAIRIKLADLDDNLDESRWPDMPASLKWRYHKAHEILTNSLDKLTGGT